ncbi:MAG: hypothetical protein EBT06_03960 [Gammaproteobacteria bacterium]|nr:hypothetical protein [Gammaproteobacteria bacterium]NBT44071.1 hypothetical protein [Gammaproteobacteria bacterium]NBY21360.1 hypothetical protein [Gammaproteobacteria bacterium]
MRVIIQNNGGLRKLLVVASSDRDGSLTLVMRREGVSRSRVSWSTKPGEQEPTQLSFDKPRPKNKRITVHQSGRVNYHENGHTIYIEPLTLITQGTCIYCYRVPSLHKLDLHTEEVDEEDAIMDLSDLGNAPVSFSVWIGTAAFMPPGKAIKLTYDVEGYSIAIEVDAEPFPVPEGYEDHFVAIIPERGPFLDQQMAEDQAMISFHRTLTGSLGPVFYHPNGEGIVRLIFSVPMRIAPKFKIELADPDLHVAEQYVQRDARSEKVMLRFKVRNRRTGQIIRQQVSVKSIELDAEL